jgi:hypothetical protein
MKTFGVVREENRKSTRKKMPKYHYCHRYFDTNYFIIGSIISWFILGTTNLFRGGGVWQFL